MITIISREETRTDEARVIVYTIAHNETGIVEREIIVLPPTQERRAA